MARKSTRLHFTDDELANSKIKKAADKAERAADKADRAAAKVPKRRKLKLEADKTAERAVRLTFQKEDIPAGELAGKKAGFPKAAFSGTIHGQVAVNTRMRTQRCRLSMPLWKQPKPVPTLLIMRSTARS